MESIYDYPLYYDILFGWDRDLEAHFYHTALQREGLRPGARVLELCCGTGQVGLRLAAKGWQITGLDIRPEMLEFMERAAEEQELTVHTMQADMRNFASFMFDGAVCPMNSFRLLQQYDEMSAHLTSVAGNLRPGGCYILDLYFSLEQQVDTDMDEWSMRRGDIEVTSHGDTIEVVDPKANRHLTLDWGGALRRYTYTEFTDIIARSGGFELVSSHPVHSETRDGRTVFDISHTSDAPDGRSMVVLTRITEQD